MPDLPNVLYFPFYDNGRWAEPYGYVVRTRGHPNPVCGHLCGATTLTVCLSGKSKTYMPSDPLKER